MHEQERGKVVRDLYAAIGRGEIPQVLSLLGDDVVFHVPGVGPNAGDWRGPEGVLAMLAQAREISGGTLRIELRDVLVGANEVVALATYRATREGGATLENHLAHVLRVEEGRVRESWFHARDQYAVDAFWSGGAS